MATHTTTDQGDIDVAAKGSFLTIVWGPNALALHPDQFFAEVEGKLLRVTYGVGSLTTAREFAFATRPGAKTAWRDILRESSLAIRAGDPAGGDVPG